MGVHHGIDVGPRAIHHGVDMEFERRLCAAFHEIAGEIDGHDVVDRQRAAHRRACVDVEGARVAPGAAVAVVVDDPRALEHANRVDELLLHDVTRLFQSSHERPTVARLIASALPPSSASSAAIGPPSAAACSWTRALISVKTARKTAAWTLGATATKPWARSSTTDLSPSASASAAPFSELLITMSVGPNFSRISKTGTPAARNAAL